MATDPRDKIWEDRADRAYSQITERPVWTTAKIFGAILAVGIALAIIGGVIGWVGGWGGEAARVTSASHSRQQVTAVLDDWTALSAAAANACDASAAASREGDPTLIEDPAFAYKAKYREIKQDYDRRMSNFFEAAVTKRLPIPDALQGLPKEAPTLKEKQAEVC